MRECPVCQRMVAIKGSKDLGWFIEPHGRFNARGTMERCPGGNTPVI